MVNYKVFGPFNIKTEKMKVGRIISNQSGFWESLPPRAKKIKLNKRPGIYVFAVKAGRGFKPYYVGKASKSFEQECFNFHKLNKYNEALSSYIKGRPVMFFIANPSKYSINKTQLSNMENFMIQMAIKRNPDLLNIIGIKQPRWAITGVIRNKGKAGKPAIKFKQMMGI